MVTEAQHHWRFRKYAQIPETPVNSTPQDNWLTEDRLKIEISKLVEERRRGDSGEMSISGTVRSMLLEKWVLDIRMALIENYTIFIPGWLINLESDKILHGRNGRLYDLVSLK